MEPAIALLGRSQDFEDRLIEVLGAIEEFSNAPKALAGGRAAQLAIEHGRATRELFGSGMPNSASAMLRAQYEAVVRSAWAIYAATALQVDRLNQPLDLESEQSAKNLPGALEMLKALTGRAGFLPELGGLVTPLIEIHTHHWRAMNSFVHGGIHPLQRSATGFPQELAETVIRASNGVMHFAFRLLARLGSSAHVVVEIDRAWIDFEDCCPMAPKTDQSAAPTAPQ